MKTIKIYIAFSIAGTNAFITATKAVTMAQYDSMLKNDGFFIISSRRPNYRSEDGVKLGWTKLHSLKGRPLRSPPLVLSRFNQLAKEGWSVDKDKFVRRHYCEHRVNSGNHQAV